MQGTALRARAPRGGQQVRGGEGSRGEDEGALWGVTHPPCVCIPLPGVPPNGPRSPGWGSRLPPPALPPPQAAWLEEELRGLEETLRGLKVSGGLWWGGGGGWDPPESGGGGSVPP